MCDLKKEDKYMNNELISIVVPVYNVEEYLEKCVSSIRNQTYKNLEIILVDDGSKDSSGVLCDKIAGEDSRIHVVHKENGGISSARNAGIEIATGKYIGFIDSDDYIDERMFELLYNALIKNNAQMSVCNYSWVDETGKVFNSTKLKEASYSSEKILIDCLLDNMAPWVVAWNKLYDISVFKEIRYPIGKINEDSFVIHHILNECKIIAIVNETLYMYFQRLGSTLNSPFRISSMDVVDSYFDRTEFYLNSKFNNKNEVALKSLLKALSSYHACYHKVKSKLITKECKEKNKEIQKKYRLLYKEIKGNASADIKDKLLMFMCNIDIQLTYRLFDLLKN